MKNKNQTDFMEINKEKDTIKYDIKYIDDFKMEIYDIKEGRFINIEKNSILFCLEGSIRINGILCEEFNSFFVKNPINYARIELNEEYNSAKLYKIYKR